jgi:hemolysin activation/secretion protein
MDRASSERDRAARDTRLGEKTENAPTAEKHATRFAVTTYVVDGNTTLKQSVIDAILDKYKGSEIQLGDIEKARLELEKAYHEAGYPTVLVTIPEQTIEGGTVRLLVVEGRIGSISVTGNEYFKNYEILEKLPSLKYGEVLYEPTFVKELDLLNIHPDRKVAPVLKPGKEQGLIDLELKVKDRIPVHGKIEGDNKGPITTPRNRLTVEVQHTNLFGGDEILTFSTIQTPTDWGAVQNYSASIVVPVIWPNHLFSLYASRAESNSVLAGGAVSVGGGDLAVAGNATIAGFRYLFPLYKSQWSTHSLSVGMDYKNLEKTEAQFPQGLGTAVVLSPIQYTPVSVGYTGNFLDSYGSSRIFGTAKGYVAGMIPGGSKEDFAGNPDDPDDPGQRVGSTGTFAVLQGGLERVQLLPMDFGLYLHVDGQWGSQPLVPAEAYFAGGMDTVRGYDNYEAIGDHAIRGRAELTTRELFQVPIDRIWQRRKSADWLFRLRAVVFYDAVNLWVQDPQPGQTSSFRLEGTGAGIRLKFPKDLGELKLDQAWALRQTSVTRRGDTFVHFSVNLTF